MKAEPWIPRFVKPQNRPIPMVLRTIPAPVVKGITGDLACYDLKYVLMTH